MDTTPGRRALWRDAVPVLVLAALTSAALVRLRAGDPSVGEVTISLLLWVPALVRRWAPLTVFGVTALLVAIHWVPSGFDAFQLLPADVALLVCLGTVTRYCRSRRAAAATAVTELFVLSTLIGTTAPAPGHPVVQLTAVTVATALVGRNLQARAAVLAGLQERVERAERDRDQQARIAVAEERTRIAREVHDVISHNVSVMTALADGAGYALRSETGRVQARRAVDSIATTGREALAEVHRLLGVLRSGEEEGDATRQPPPGLAELPALVQQVRAAGLPTTLTVTGAPAPLGTAAQLAVYRLVQEALTNTRRHGTGARRASVELTWADAALAVTVRDDGRGAPPSAEHVGHGLIGMRERIGAQGGSISAGPGAYGGWQVTALLPLPARVS